GGARRADRAPRCPPRSWRRILGRASPPARGPGPDRRAPDRRLLPAAVGARPQRRPVDAAERVLRVGHGDRSRRRLVGGGHRRPPRVADQQRPDDPAGERQPGGEDNRRPEPPGHPTAGGASSGAGTGARSGLRTSSAPTTPPANASPAVMSIARRNPSATAPASV